MKTPRKAFVNLSLTDEFQRKSLKPRLPRQARGRRAPCPPRANPAQRRTSYVTTALTQHHRPPVPRHRRVLAPVPRGPPPVHQRKHLLPQRSVNESTTVHPQTNVPNFQPQPTPPWGFAAFQCLFMLDPWQGGSGKIQGPGNHDLHGVGHFEVHNEGGYVGAWKLVCV